MERLNCLRWAAGLSLSAYGVRAGVRVRDPAVLQRVGACLPLGSRPSQSPLVDGLYSLVVGGEGPRPGTRRYSLLYEESARLIRTMELDDLFEVLESNLQLHVAEFARNKLFVHAGVVGW